MTDDIVQRLRDDGGHPDLAHPLCVEAADALEARDAKIEQLRAERDSERALADRLADALCQMVTWSCCPDRNFGPCGCGPDAAWLPEGEVNAEVIAAHKEARRG